MYQQKHVEIVLQMKIVRVRKAYDWLEMYSLMGMWVVPFPNVNTTFFTAVEKGMKLSFFYVFCLKEIRTVIY